MERRAVMGWQLVREAEDHGPASLTWRERFALSVLANAAMDETRECPRGIEDNPEIIRRLRLVRSARYEVISALCKKGALIQVERGRNGVQAVYAIAPFVALAQLMGLENPDPSESANGFKGPGTTDASPVDNPSEGPENPDPSEGDGPLKGPGFTAEGSGKPGLKGPENPDPRRDDRDYEETRTTHARAHEAVRSAVPDATDGEIEEAIRIIKARFKPKKLLSYLTPIINRGDIFDYIPCGLNPDRKHSERCRARDCENCTSSWCEGRCHSRRAKRNRPA